MATERYYNCSKCHKRTHSSELLFDELIDFPASIPTCFCGESNELLLIPPFAFGAGGKCFKVLDAFHEEVSWEDNGKSITFYPFLIVLENTDDKSMKVWLPYWHLEESKRKFGERAPWMDAELLDGLLAKARAKGYLQ
jgi:hypothetical protein